MVDTIAEYHDTQVERDRKICELLEREINDALPEAESKIWHGHPVWFISDNPIVGYSKLKDCVRLLFWSGQSFDGEGLQPEGSFKAAEVRYTDKDEVDIDRLQEWLEESRETRWDYKNIVKRKGELKRLQ